MKRSDFLGENPPWIYFEEGTHVIPRDRNIRDIKVSSFNLWLRTTPSTPQQPSRTPYLGAIPEFLVLKAKHHLNLSRTTVNT